jgi:hypothetical protein
MYVVIVQINLVVKLRKMVQIPAKVAHIAQDITSSLQKVFAFEVGKVTESSKTIDLVYLVVVCGPDRPDYRPYGTSGL